jgi:hypothetical protein
LACSLKDLIFKCHALGIVLREPCRRSVSRGEDFDMVRIANLHAGVDVDKNSHKEVPRADHKGGSSSGAMEKREDLEPMASVGSMTPPILC